jgi:UDP:flavonoid glycosyltransferase YjiC (YdhE family)
MARYDWSPADLAAKLAFCINDPAMKAKLAATSAHMQAQDGSRKAAAILGAILDSGMAGLAGDKRA